MKPSVSVIIINYNAGKLLTKAVKSVINYPGVEVVVVDNASRDSSMAELEQAVKVKNLVTIYNSDNPGFGKAVNQAARRARGQYLYLLNPDAALTRRALTRMVATAQQYGNRAIIAPRLENPDGTPQRSCYHSQTLKNALREYWFGIKGAYEKYLPRGQHPRPVEVAVAAAWLVPKQVWQELGGLNEKYFLYFEDLDFCDRARRNNIPVIYDPQAVVKHAHGVSSRTNPIVMQLFQRSALTYHGRIKKILLDFIILSRNLFTPPVTFKKLLTLLFSWAGGILGMMVLGYFLLPSRLQPLPFLPSFFRSNFLLWSWANFDGEHYLRIARDGYQLIRGQSQYAFFPLFPLLINFLSRTGLDSYLSAHLIVGTSLIAFAFTFIAWVKRYTSRPLSALTLILLSPGAIFLLAIYTEPLFLFLTVLTFLFADRRQWGRAVFTAALASATRVNGLFLALFLFCKLRRNRFSLLQSILAFLVSLSGFFAYLDYLYLRTGDALAFYHAQSGWGKDTVTPPWSTLSQYFRTVTTGFSPDLSHLVVVIEVLLTLLLFYLLVRFWRFKKTSPAYNWYLLANLALPLATGSLGSMPRFSLALFPLFLVIPLLHRRLKLFIYFFFLASAIIGVILFTRGFWYA